jgi:hypothetical protein
MVYVTHDQVEAMSMADRVILLNRGRIEQNAPPVELYENPANTFVARFIGTPPMNLLPLDRCPRARRSPAPAARGAPADCAGLTLGIRPEHIALGFQRGVRAQSRRSNTWAPIRSSRAAGQRVDRRARRRQRRPCRAATRLAVVGARRAASVRADGRRRAEAFVRDRSRCSLSSHDSFHNGGGDHVQKTVRRASSWSPRSPRLCARAGAGRDLVLLPGGVGGPIPS